MFTNPYLLALIFIVFLAGCVSRPAIQPSNPDGKLSYGEIKSELEKGQMKLGCGVSCSGKWGQSLKHLSKLYESNQWQDLAVHVINVGFNGQLPYFYLGRAAEGLGMYEAAKTYYVRAEDRYPCAGFFNVCNGLDIPAEIKKSREAIASIEARKASAAQNQVIPVVTVVAPVQYIPAPQVESTLTSNSPEISRTPPVTQAAPKSPVKHDVPKLPQKASVAPNSSPLSKPAMVARPARSEDDAAEAEGKRDGTRFAYDLRRIGERADGTACAVGMAHGADRRSHYSQVRLEAYAKAFGNACTGRKVF